ncbi:MAG: phosphoenolpyruvate--protein phosphotransferase [Balneolales bacterium]|nr:phosphoenolpyruvate--protein phosphotransferase [Balneolales bacterium]
MVGLVIVSHSEKLAESLKELSLEMGRGNAKIETAGGIDDPDNPIGTDAMRILNAIQTVYSEEGVIVFMDMGSAIMSTEMALEFLDEEQRGNVRLCSAPIVEGVVAAAALAGAGAGINEVIREAMASAKGKAAQLGEEVTTGNEEPVGTDEEDSLKLIFTLRNTMGLHARPAAKIVQSVTGRKVSARITNISKNSNAVSAGSMNSIISLAARQGDEVKIVISGEEMDEVATELNEMFETHFGESTAPAPKKRHFGMQSKAEEVDTDFLKGIPITHGYASGPATHYTIELPEIQPAQDRKDKKKEKQAFDKALGEAEAQMKELVEKSRKRMGANEAAIFEAQLLLLNDPELLDRVYAKIENNLDATYAWYSALQEVVQMYQNITGDSLVATRVIDLVDIGKRVISRLTGKSFEGPDIKEPCILCMKDISPSDTAGLDPDLVMGILCEQGSDLSHSAIIARSLGIPSIFNLGRRLRDIEEGEIIAMDSELGHVFVNPTEDQLLQTNRMREKWQQVKDKAFANRKKKAVTKDGIPVAVMANIGNEHDLNQVQDVRANGVGLFRTEFLFMERDSRPDEHEQYKVYKKAVQVLDGRGMLTIRTIDVGGDKPVDYLPMDAEENPFLGKRGIRYSLSEPDLFCEQIRAIIRSAAHGSVGIMFPMVATIEELDAVLLLLEDSKKKVFTQFPDIEKEVTQNLKLGIMAEVPSIIELIPDLSGKIDFVSIGTNDLAQYVMAADRTNSQVANLASYFQPAVLKAVEKIIRSTIEAGIEISICGEMARDPLLTPFLIDCGLRKFSMSVSGIPEFKFYLRGLDAATAATIASEVRSCKKSADVQKTLREALLK